MDFELLCDEVLSLIEYDETSLLDWGFVEVEHSLERRIPEILEKLNQRYIQFWGELQEQGKTSQDILDNLLDRKLIFRDSKGFYRSRFAETMRLMILLRQRFSYDDWATAPRLVGDARIQLQRRRYPRRDIDFEQLANSLTDITTDKQRQILQLLIQGYHLSGFQQRAIQNQLRLLKLRGEHGIVIGAGTGAGKTKAFYVPALTWLVTHMTTKHQVSIIAIYPRVELLKDQFAEAARETERLNADLDRQDKRQISLGAYYGDTPRSATDNYIIKSPDQNWPAPFLKCPHCGGTLEWRVDDRKRNHTVLRCLDPECGYATDPKHILLTRQQMVTSPPDILFTTTEMLNRHLANVDEAEVFGIRATQPPRLLLLDEIHTYEGISGANVAYLLRRWRKACGYSDGRHSLCIVGLSATLSQASEMFAKLTGLYQSNIFDVRPHDDELEDEGIEYNVVLKYDPSAGTALLSTSIQIAMLLGRTLSPLKNNDHTYAPKIFAFGNQLDVVNRWYDNQVDAEKEQRLSQYRFWDNLQIPYEQRESIKRSGQDWQVASLIGNDLTKPMKVDRTSSQVKGVAQDAKLVIATSALEVGFNDPQVGAVIQHKLPQSMASFLQRKGRAGRNRRTRPWTVVITSAYGRDRWALQNAEVLFNPLLPPINLPVENYYVQKIQAAYILMDWLAAQLCRSLPKLNLWNLLSGARGSGSNQRSDRNEVSQYLEKLITDSSVRDHYIAYLQDAMGLKGEENGRVIQSVLWGEPRPILLEVIPTIVRQLRANWQQISVNNKDEPMTIQPDRSGLSDSPMPEFVPPTLFSELNLPEIRVHIGQVRTETAPFIQTFGELLPGKVTKRYLPEGSFGKNGFWIGLPDERLDTCFLQNLPLEYDPIPIELKSENRTYLLKRPTVYHLQPIPENLATSSTAFAEWRSAFQPKSLHMAEATPLRLYLRPQSVYQEVITEIDVYTQSLGMTIQVTRGLIGVQLSHLVNKERIYKKVYFTEENQSASGGDTSPIPAGLGYNLDVDGICIKYSPLKLESLKLSLEWETILQSIRPLFYLYRLQQDTVIKSLNLTPFEVEWLSQIVHSTLTSIAVANHQTMREACSFVEAGFVTSMTRTMNVIFQGQSFEDDDFGKLQTALLERLKSPELQVSLLGHATVFWEKQPMGLDQFLELQYASSVGATFFAAVTGLVEDIDDSALQLDIEHDEYRFWITETTPGGIGLIAKIVETMSQQPRHLELQLTDAIRHCGREQLALELNAITRLLNVETSEVSRAFSAIRDKQDFVSVSHAKQQLSQALDYNGISATRSLIVTINAKFLRPNSDRDMDLLIVELLQLWHDEQSRLGCKIDLRSFAVAANRRDLIQEQLDQVLKRISSNQRLDDNRRYNLLQSMLWIDCHDSCEDCIQYNPRYQNLVRPSRHLLYALTKQTIRVIQYGNPNWKNDFKDILSNHYDATVCCDYDEIKTAKRDLAEFLTASIEVGLQLFSPTIEQIERRDNNWYIHFILREMVGA